MSACSTIPEKGVARGEVLYKNCVQCHGDAGYGNVLVAAPQIAGLPAWYTERQVLNFQSGMRGAHPDDTEGLKMRPMSRMLKTDADVKAVADYLASLPPAKTDTSLNGDAAKGQAAFAVCTSCHGTDGAGNESLGAPPLRNLQDWYIVSQLAKFKSGHRAYAKSDTTGASMKAMAAVVADEAAARDLAAHIHTLASGGK